MAAESRAQRPPPLLLLLLLLLFVELTELWVQLPRQAATCQLLLPLPMLSLLVLLPALWLQALLLEERSISRARRQLQGEVAQQSELAQLPESRPWPLPPQLAFLLLRELTELWQQLPRQAATPHAKLLLLQVRHLRHVLQLLLLPPLLLMLLLPLLLPMLLLLLTVWLHALHLLEERSISRAQQQRQGEVEQQSELLAQTLLSTLLLCCRRLPWPLPEGLA